MLLFSVLCQIVERFDEECPTTLDRAWSRQLRGAQCLARPGDDGRARRHGWQLDRCPILATGILMPVRLPGNLDFVKQPMRSMAAH